MIHTPPLDHLPAEVQQAAAAYAKSWTAWSEADAICLGAQASLNNADIIDIKAMESAILRGEDPAEVESVREQFERDLHKAERVRDVWAKQQRNDLAALFDLLMQHKPAEVERLILTLVERDEEVQQALRQLSAARARYGEAIAQANWWHELGLGSMPPYTGAAPATTTLPIDATAYRQANAALAASSGA